MAEQEELDRIFAELQDIKAFCEKHYDGGICDCPCNCLGDCIMLSECAPCYWSLTKRTVFFE